ncbi:cytochrome c oxidase subunit II [Rhizosaccharibacter radicis]|uniref:cytochrome-c oxidase n=1 Tax=Rhizosaccharibacter radicis TaxID=2782605 RepID=A0ABT1VT13_9PROT|nr:cytochrome c oxidase subunit II [Acetobacteraceae bacterium KSS12]
MNGGNRDLALWPIAASAGAHNTDHLVWAFTLVTLMLTVPIFVGFTIFSVIYRDGRPAHREYKEKKGRSEAIELSWMLIPFALTLAFFAWGARMFDIHRHPPANAITISAIGRQWMWKFQHPGGQAEINDLHVPTGQPVRITMISQDVIHALYLPALRIQMETLPGRYTELWFNADKPGTYRLYCSEYCGTDHSKMQGLLYVMKPGDYQAWLAHQGASQTLTAKGRQLFAANGCAGCHENGSTVRAPSLHGLFGQPVPMEAGGTVIADESYLRDKILDPDKNRIAGYKQLMPSFKGVLAEEDVVALVAYLRALGPKEEGASAEDAPDRSTATGDSTP